MDESQRKLLEQLELLSPYFEELILLLKNVNKLTEGVEKASDSFAEKIKSVTAEVVIPESVQVKEVTVDITKFRETIRDIVEELKTEVHENVTKEVTIKDPETIKPNVEVKIEHLKEIEQLLTKLLEAQKKEIVVKAAKDIKISNREPSEAIPARLVTKEGKDFYTALARVMTSGGSGGGADKVYNIRVAVSGSVTYVGESDPGTPAASSGWRIRKIDESSGTVITWAAGNSNFDKIWDNRLTYTYS